MRVATVFVLIVFSILALCGAEDSSDTGTSLLEREAREAKSPVRQKKSKNSQKIKKKKNSKNSRKIKKKENSKTKKRNNNKGKGLRKSKLGKSKKQRKRKMKRKNQKKRWLKKVSNKRKSKAKNEKQKEKKARKVFNQVEKSSKDTCTDPDNQDKVTRNVQKQANKIVVWFKLLGNKADKGDVFANFSKTLEEMTDNENICGAAKNASEFLSRCPATAKSACNTSDFEANFTRIETECVPVNCSMTSECRELIKVTHRGLLDIKRNSCLNSTVPGSFSNCMKFVKELGNDIIKDCVAEIKDSSDETCSGETVSIIQLTDMVPSITTRSLIGRSRKRFY